MSIDARAAAAELARRALIKESQPDILSGAFPAQRTFLLDRARLKAAHCSRGAAKSYTAGLGIYLTMMAHPGTSCIYVTKTHDMARNIMWDKVMRTIDRDFGLGIEFNETRLEGRHPNGATFRLMGIDGDRRQQDKLLGGKYMLVVLDEVAFFDTDLTEIVYKTILPAVGRIGGSVWMMSTSSDYPRGLFYDITKPDIESRTKGWTLHEWQWYDNPYIKDSMQGTIDELIKANPLIVETNHYKQHYLNLWAIDETALVYKYSASKNRATGLPKLASDGWTRVLGVDTGWEDDNAFVLTAYHVNDPHVYIVKSYHAPHMTFDQVADKIKEFQADSGLSPHKIIVDGANKQGVESMRARSHIPFEKADKLDKATFIELCNSDLVSGKVKILPGNEDLEDEMARLVWVTESGKIKYPKKEHPAAPNHLCDGWLYAWRMGYHYNSVPREKKAVQGSREWYLQQAEGIWDRERDRLEATDGEAENFAFSRLG